MHPSSGNIYQASADFAILCLFVQTVTNCSVI